MSKEKTPPASPSKASPGLKLEPKYIGRITGTLLGICLVTALLLGIVNQVTKPRIDAIQEARTEAAMAQVLPAERYEALETDAANVTALYAGYNGGETVPSGFVVEVTTNGSQGAISMVVGVDGSGAVTGVAVTKHSETANLGTKVVDDQSVLDRFTGMSHADGEITVNSGSNRFDGVSGATVSSKGVTAGVNTALSAVEPLLVKEG